MKTVLFLALLGGVVLGLSGVEKSGGLTLEWEKNILTVRGERIPGGKVETWYLEAYCRPGSTDREWGQTTIGHRTELVSRSPDGRRIELRCVLTDGVTVRHVIEAGDDEVHFHLTAHNPTDRPSAAHWAQPCVRVGPFTGGDQESYVSKCFIFENGRLARMPTRDWATKARYTPGQVWAAPGVDRNDVNPRPLNPHVPDHGLIGCFSANEKMILALVWEPYQELFQGVGACIHSDFRIGGLSPGETKEVRGRMYIVPHDVPALLERYRKDFPGSR